MGCDIHAFLEIKHYHHEDTERKKGIWISADKWVRNSDEVVFPKDRHRRYNVDYDDRIYKGRNYVLFAKLADVRNAHGETKPISEPKGMPDDASEETKAEAEYWDEDGHSHSYLTLAELLPHGLEEISPAFEQTLEKMKSFIREGRSNPAFNTTADDIRLVFWFDN